MTNVPADPRIRGILAFAVNAGRDLTNLHELMDLRQRTVEPANAAAVSRDAELLDRAVMIATQALTAVRVLVEVGVAWTKERETLRARIAELEGAQNHNDPHTAPGNTDA